MTVIRKYIKPKQFTPIENDKYWGDLIGPKFMDRLRKMYEIPDHSHINGLMSCGVCTFLVLQYKEDYQEYLNDET